MSVKSDKVTAEEQVYKPIPFAKKHRISVGKATVILEKHGADRKSADEEARRAAV